MKYGENLMEIDQKTAEIWPVECTNIAIHFLICVSVKTESKITENV